MSSMPFDPSQLGTAGGGASPAPVGGGAQGGGDPLGGASVAPPPTGDPSDILKQITDMFNVYMQEETDPQDLAEASDLQARVHKLLANQQKMVDTATGSGPGARLMRKATASQGGGGAQGGGGGGY